MLFAYYLDPLYCCSEWSVDEIRILSKLLLGTSKTLFHTLILIHAVVEPCHPSVLGLVQKVTRVAEPSTRLARKVPTSDL